MHLPTAGDRKGPPLPPYAAGDRKGPPLPPHAAGDRKGPPLPPRGGRPQGSAPTSTRGGRPQGRPYLHVRRATARVRPYLHARRATARVRPYHHTRRAAGASRQSGFRPVRVVSSGYFTRYSRIPRSAAVYAVAAVVAKRQGSAKKRRNEPFFALACRLRALAARRLRQLVRAQAPRRRSRTACAAPRRPSQAPDCRRRRGRPLRSHLATEGIAGPMRRRRKPPWSLRPG